MQDWGAEWQPSGQRLLAWGKGGSPSSAFPPCLLLAFLFISLYIITINLITKIPPSLLLCLCLYVSLPFFFSLPLFYQPGLFHFSNASPIHFFPRPLPGTEWPLSMCPVASSILPALAASMIPSMPLFPNPGH